jgi:hypothetical protein
MMMIPRTSQVTEHPPACAFNLRRSGVEDGTSAPNPATAAMLLGTAACLYPIDINAQPSLQSMAVYDRPNALYRHRL